LKKHYFEPVIVPNYVLAGGKTLRNQTSRPRIELQTEGYIALKKRIDKEKKNKNDTEIYRLLSLLEDHEMKPASLGGRPFADVFGTRSAAKSEEMEVSEIIDLTEDGPEIVNVDEFILDFLKAEKVNNEYKVSQEEHVRVKRERLEEDEEVVEEGSLKKRK
jgi:hypothetical protein